MSTSTNHLIERLPRKDRSRLLALGEPFELLITDVLCDAGLATRYVYFPISGFISLVTRTDGKLGLEVGMVGREGMLGTQLVLGVAVSPLHAVVQGAGIALRIEARAFAGELAASAAMRKILGRYLYVMMAQLASSAACLRFHVIAPRLARWLLMSQDRAESDHFRVTHEFLAYMLGVRRVGITLAAGSLQRDGLIDYRRGNLQVLDRPGLEAMACSCYATDRHAYVERIG